MRRPSRFVFHRSSAFAVLANLVVGGCASGPKADPSSDAELAVADSPSIEPAPATIPTESDFKLVASIFGPDGVAQADADSEEPSVDEGDALRTWLRRTGS